MRKNSVTISLQKVTSSFVQVFLCTIEYIVLVGLCRQNQMLSVLKNICKGKTYISDGQGLQRSNLKVLRDGVLHCRNGSVI